MARGRSLMPRMALVVLVGLMGTEMHDFVAWTFRGSMTGSGLREGPRTRRQQSPRQSELPMPPPLRTVEAARSELEAILEELGEHLPWEELEQLADLQRHWDSQLRVLLVGDFSSGKSTLTNVLVGKLVAETGRKPTTADLCEYACVKHNNIVLVDSPGINAAGGREHKEQVLEDVKRADYVLFVMKATSPGTDSEAELQDLLSKYDTPGILVLSHWDGLDTEEREEVEDEAKRFAAKAFPGKKPELFFINGKEAEKAIKCGKQHSETGCMRLESFLQEKLTDKTVQLSHKLNTFRSQAKVIVQRRLSHIPAEMQQKEAAHGKAMGDFDQQQSQLKEELQRLSKDKSRMDSELQVLNTDEERDIEAREGEVKEREDENAQDGGFVTGAFKGAGQAGAAGAAAAGPPGALVGGLLGGLVGACRGHMSKGEKQRMEAKAAGRLWDAKDRYKQRKERVEADIDEVKGQLEMNKKKQTETQSDRRAAKGKFEQKMEDLSQEEHALEGLLRRLHAWEPAKEF